MLRLKNTGPFRGDRCLLCRKGSLFASYVWCVIVALFAGGISPVNAESHKLEKTVRFEAIAEAFLGKDVTVRGVAESIGSLGGKNGTGYDVRLNDPSLRGAYIGIAPGAMGVDVKPEYVDFYFADNISIPLAKAVPSCKQWKRMPNPPDRFTYFYVCDFEKSISGVRVTFLAELTAEMGDPSSHLKELTIRRDA